MEVGGCHMTYSPAPGPFPPFFHNQHCKCIHHAPKPKKQPLNTSKLQLKVKRKPGPVHHLPPLNTHMTYTPMMHFPMVSTIPVWPYPSCSMHAAAVSQAAEHGHEHLDPEEQERKVAEKA